MNNGFVAPSGVPKIPKLDSSNPEDFLNNPDKSKKKKKSKELLEPIEPKSLLSKEIKKLKDFDLRTY